MRGLFTFLCTDWGTSIYDTQVHRANLLVRLRWFIAIRWIAVVCYFTLAAGGYLQLVPLGFEYTLLAGAALFLALTNLLFDAIGRRLPLEGASGRGLLHLVVAQITTDYLVLALVSYATGGLELPIVTFFVAEIILVSLFCPPALSLGLTLAAVGFAALPLVLEYLGLIPTRSILNAPYKQMLISNPYHLISYIGVVTLGFLFCWYLVAEITLSLRQREHELEQTQAKLIQLDKEKAQATLRATHELKAPLAAINSYIYTLRDGYCGALPDKALQVLERIRIRVDLLMSKISDIIQLSNLRTRIREGAQMEPIDLTQSLGTEIREASLIGQARGIQVIDLTPEAPSYSILGAREQLQSMISNLLRNAIHYSHDGGTISVSLTGTQDQVRLVIEDQGIGIPEGSLEHIFDEHFRSSNAVKHHPNGTGLGLSLVKEIAQIHHASIEVSSQLGKGTQFTLTFPLL